jgi:methylmalonyl-CoA mutase N-terminal domain/subunit
MALGFVQMRHLIRKLIARGVSVDSFAPRIAFLVDCGMDFFEEIAKIRATRRIYALMMRNEFGAQNERSMSIAISGHTSGLSLTAQQPANNIVRGTLQALSLVLGGVQALEISAFDEAFRPPSKEAHIVGLRTQQIIDLESGAAKVLDPLAGSYFVEQLTDELEARIRARIDEIEAMGDPEALTNQGFFRDIFHQAMKDAHRLVEKGEMSMVGVNVHAMSEVDDTLLRDVSTSKIEPWHGHTQRIERFRCERNMSRRSMRRLAWAKLSRPCAGRSASRAMCLINRCLRPRGSTVMAQELVALAVMGIDQHENGVMAISRVLAEAQMRVDYLGKYHSPASVAEKAIA